MRKEDLKIALQDGTIIISGERKPGSGDEKGTWIRNEISKGNFKRTVVLPHDVKDDAVTAELSDGLLRIVLPKEDEIRPREIHVK